ncbi:hypothetical protein A4R35_10135 [Thermogemmatispora tikiterensis]|uniref:Methyltransferase domain-containing protein n=1 Tax=Thermogemmatispora tikiterensis TaxID=1825093 RepID=A0A328VP08_9CHLR|nr:hypothetical protein A4R35_10135 [Thermogemmatispora tikiterensis]
MHFLRFVHSCLNVVEAFYSNIPMQSYDILPAQHRILDLTCGPDGWDLELAFHFPNAHVLGVDINP